MTVNVNSMKDAVLVAIDISKARNDVLVQLPNGTKKKPWAINKALINLSTNLFVGR